MHQERFLSIDAFRGLTMVAMVLVNNPGSWSFVYPPLRHAAWHGATPTDLVFPFFLFIVGMSMTFSLGRRLRDGARPSALHSKILTRALILVALGLLLNFIPKFSLAELRIPGVLQRIGLCYLFGALIYLRSNTAGRAGVSTLLLLLYTALLLFVPVPGFGAWNLDAVGNLPGYVDTRLMAGHLWRPDFDPEGLLSTIPAVVTVLLGTMLGDWLRSSRTIINKCLGIFGAGIPLAAAGLLLNSRLPLNKALWTPSFVLYTAGLALLVFGACFLLIDVLRWKNWAVPFFALGSNALAVFVGSSLLAKALLSLRIAAPDGGSFTGAAAFFHAQVFSPLAGPYLGSLIWAVLNVLLWVGLMAPLYRHRLYLKI